MRPDGCRMEEVVDVPSLQDWDLFREWARLEGWRVPARELALYRQELAASAFVLRNGSGSPLGFVTVCRQQRSAWIGNLLVDPKHRGQRYGRRLFEHAVAFLSARGVATLWLTASAGGRHLYESCGFCEVGWIERWVHRGGGATSRSPYPSGCGDLYALARADAAAWGYSRAELLTLLARGGQIFSANSTVALLQPGDDLCVLGPWLSADLCPRANRTVLSLALEAATGCEEIALDVVGGSPATILLGAAGFHQAGETVMMMRGEAGRVRLNEIVALASLGSLG